MWTGPPFDEFSAEAWAGPEVVRLTELHASAVEDHAIELIAARRWAEAVAELQAHVTVHPLRDRPRGLLLQALAGAGRQADALGAFRDYRAYLVDSVGTEPSAEVRRLDRRVASGWDGTETTAGSSADARRPARWLPLTQLVRHWAESGRLVLDTRVELAGDESGEEVPANLRDLLWSRVTALGNDVLVVLSAAAVLGTEFAEDALIDMVEIPEHVAMDALDLAERARLVVDVEPQARTMRFVHALVAGAVYSELPGRRRRRLHARAAQVLEKRSDAPATNLAAQLARHYALGGLLAEALRWARLAGDHAADRLSPAEAARWYRTALEHTVIVEVADHERADLLARLGRAQHQINDPAALATLTEAAALARRCGATPIVVQAALATDRGFLHLGSVPSAQVDRRGRGRRRPAP